MAKRIGQILAVVVVGVAIGGSGYLLTRNDGGPTGTQALGTTTTVDGPSTITGRPLATTTEPPPATTSTSPIREPGVVPGWTVGRPWGETVGVTMFRGNPTRSYYGEGPVPTDPSVVWRYPDSPMCSTSSVGGESRVWCGMGWTGQPALWERPDGVTELVFGAYDAAVHFVDAVTGEDLRPKFQTGDIIKGSVTVDPDGYPLAYFGSRDNKLRIIALDRESSQELWSLDASAVNGIWNNDWDSNPVVVDDILYEGGENGWFFAVELNRGFDSDGQVTVEPQVVFQMPGYDDDLLAKSGRNVSIESSVLAFDDRVYFTNSGGRIVGLDVSDIRSSEASIVFDYYSGGDIDATMTTDADGMLYVSIEYEPGEMGSVERERALEVGQLVKLDPYTDGDPRIWGLDLTSGSSDAGSWSTPAVGDGVVYVNTHLGRLLAVDAEDGEILWSDDVGWHAWSSPVIVDEHLVTATCLGDLRAYSLADERAPVLDWSVNLGGTCLEATPVVWKGRIFIGGRDGYLRSVG